MMNKPKRRRPQKALAPLLITDSPWRMAIYLPPSELGPNRRSKPLLIVCKHKEFQPKPDIVIGWYDHHHSQWRNNFGKITGVTHWMPLPEPPKGGLL